MGKAVAMGLTLEKFDALCGHWPGVTRDIKWGADLVYSVGGKMFAITSADRSVMERLTIKVPAERFLELTDRPGIIPSPYLARAHWVAVTDVPRYPTQELEAFIRTSYTEVRQKLTKKYQSTLGPLPPH
ncbi:MULTISPECIES: MmcQ/YjbR family DNA-binding protein [Dyella]|uniref:MmcQ/YjbR family DNA-binding protein n=2 Tax=Dyella TaxID=231454 RepID=A0A4V2NMK0_9GAMM|nr:MULTISPECIES: MmcQ/YjbR family DNA-binding protein [Dyella]TBR38822.1 MmcQ/YjbR family DNA-binding protein [Dyella terrae]TCI13587.1 MmcQ/YjbR family DNA-binding protein [Dyella soli]